MKEQLQALQEFLNQCIELGRTPRGETRFVYTECGDAVSFCGPIISGFRGETHQSKLIYSYHDIFSYECGLMEFVKRVSYKDRGIEVLPPNSEGYLERSNTRKDNHVQYHYMIMGPMTAEEKISYFLNNALLPTT